MKRVTVSAPGKLMLLGEHAVVYNRPCLVTAVDQRIYLTIERTDEENFQLEAPDVKVTGYKKAISELGIGDIPKGAQFVEIAIKNIAEKYPLKSGIRVVTISEFSSQFGFGSSSASTVCTIKAISELLGLNLSQREIFDLSYKTVLDIQGKGSGFDVAAAVFGGTLYFMTGGKVIEPLNISGLPLMVGYSGVKADTVILINKVKESFANRQDRLNEMYNGIEVLVNYAKNALVKKKWAKFGELMNKNQNYLRELGVSSDKLDDMIKRAIDAGAYGAKLSGAGGGDCMIALSPEDKVKSVERAITKAGGEVLSVKTNAEGVRTE